MIIYGICSIGNDEYAYYAINLPTDIASYFNGAKVSYYSEKSNCELSLENINLMNLLPQRLLAGFGGVNTISE